MSDVMSTSERDRDRLIAPLFADSGKEIFADDIGEVQLKRRSKRGSHDLISDDEWIIDEDESGDAIKFEIVPQETTQQDIGTQFGPGEYLVMAFNRKKRKLGEHMFSIAPSNRAAQPSNRRGGGFAGRSSPFAGRSPFSRYDDQDDDDPDGDDDLRVSPFARRDSYETRRKIEDLERKLSNQNNNGGLDGVAKLIEVTRQGQRDPLDVAKMFMGQRSSGDDEALKALRDQLGDLGRAHRRELDAAEDRLKEAKDAHRRELETMRESFRSELDAVKHTLRSEIKSKEKELDENRNTYRRELESREDALREIRKTKSAELEDERRRLRDDLDDVRKRAERDRDDDRRRHQEEIASLRKFGDEHYVETKARLEREIKEMRQEIMELVKKNKEQASEIIELERDLAATPSDPKPPPPPGGIDGKTLTKNLANGKSVVEIITETAVTKFGEYLSQPKAAPQIAQGQYQQAPPPAPMQQPAPPPAPNPMPMAPPGPPSPTPVPPPVPRLALQEVGTEFFANELPPSNAVAVAEPEAEDEEEEEPLDDQDREVVHSP